MTIRVLSAAAFAGAGLLSACVPVAVPAPPPVVVVPNIGTPPADACNSAAYQQFVGQRSPGITLPPGTDVRHYRTGDAVTMDYSAERINFEYDRRGVLVRVSCG
ncbi:I78 family peptidase inhibitor [Paracoccus sp. S-4012]|uniref:I78 family peptidase inhibitor n=1 Tax=Paracoccus sp. S-4012 TaxID=2665648 RepID=UPI0018A23C47|nr:I78 family peptidase inhibitor [Paracoccus sp. S-4012]